YLCFTHHVTQEDEQAAVPLQVPATVDDDPRIGGPRVLEKFGRGGRGHAECPASRQSQSKHTVVGMVDRDVPDAGRRVVDGAPADVYLVVHVCLAGRRRTGGTTLRSQKAATETRVPKTSTYTPSLTPGHSRTASPMRMPRPPRTATIHQVCTDAALLSAAGGSPRRRLATLRRSPSKPPIPGR